jgi:hypothetical protein
MAERAPFFSVLMAAWNQVEYVAEALDSVADQEFTDWEVVVVDDGSTDGTGERIEAWAAASRAARPNRVTVERIANSGQSSALEHGFGRCTGRYVALLDSDDRWLSGKLAAVHAAAVADPEAGMLGHPLLVIDPEGRRTGDVRPARARLSGGDLREQVRRTGRQVATATSGVVIRADVFRSLLPMPTRGLRSGADSYLTFGASLAAPVRVVPEALAEYRIHPGSQYLSRMMTAEGLERSVALQRAVAGHFGLEAAVGRNAYFARNDFAAAKLGGGAGRQVRAFRRLAAATLGDGAFTVVERALLLGWWTVCLAAPRALFLRLWRAFQLRQTGYGRVLRGAAR